MFYERNLSRKYLVLCLFTFPGGNGNTNHSGLMISVNASKDIEREFQEVAAGLNYKHAKLTAFIPDTNKVFKAKTPVLGW